MLAKMGALLELKADLPKSETLHDLKQLAAARQGLTRYTTLIRFGLIWRHGSIAVIGSVRNSLRI